MSHSRFQGRCTPLAGSSVPLYPSPYSNNGEVYQNGIFICFFSYRISIAMRCYSTAAKQLQAEIGGSDDSTRNTHGKNTVRIGREQSVVQENKERTGKEQHGEAELPTR